MTYAKLHDIKSGDTVIVDEGFTCMPPATKIVYEDVDGLLWIECEEGKHYLDGQLNKFNEYVGIKKGEVK